MDNGDLQLSDGVSFGRDVATEPGARGGRLLPHKPETPQDQAGES